MFYSRFRKWTKSTPSKIPVLTRRKGGDDEKAPVQRKKVNLTKDKGDCSSEIEMMERCCLSGVQTVMTVNIQENFPQNITPILKSLSSEDIIQKPEISKSFAKSIGLDDELDDEPEDEESESEEAEETGEESEDPDFLRDLRKRKQKSYSFELENLEQISIPPDVGTSSSQLLLNAGDYCIHSTDPPSPKNEDYDSEDDPSKKKKAEDARCRRRITRITIQR